jgi:hypothetical protein
MMRKTLLMCAILSSFAMMPACTLLQGKSGGNSGADTGTGGDRQKLIVGSWKIAAVHCDSQGNNCEWYTGKRVFQFLQNGNLYVNDIKRATYRMEGSACILDTGAKRYTVNIISIDSGRMVTGENNRTTTEIYNKIK